MDGGVGIFLEQEVGPVAAVGPDIEAGLQTVLPGEGAQQPLFAIGLAVVAEIFMHADISAAGVEKLGAQEWDAVKRGEQGIEETGHFSFSLYTASAVFVI